MTQNKSRCDQRDRLEKALIAVARQDQVAFRGVYEMSASTLFNVCFRVCGQQQAAEDVLQEVFVSIWTHAASYDAKRSSPMTWLMTIARNRAIDWWRANRIVDVVPAHEAELVIDARLSTLEAMLIDEMHCRLDACIDDLSESERSIILAAFLDGLTYAEQAARSNVPLGTIKSRARRGLSRLRNRLKTTS